MGAARFSGAPAISLAGLRLLPSGLSHDRGERESYVAFSRAVDHAPVAFTHREKRPRSL